MKRKLAGVEAAEQGRDRKKAKSKGAVAPKYIARDKNVRGEQPSTAKPSTEKSDVARREALDFKPRAAGIVGGEKAPTYRDTCRDCQVCVLLVSGLSVARACGVRISDAIFFYSLI
jgi:hypothetical protein